MRRTISRTTNSWRRSSWSPNDGNTIGAPRDIPRSVRANCRPTACVRLAGLSRPRRGLAEPEQQPQERIGDSGRKQMNEPSLVASEVELALLTTEQVRRIPSATIDTSGHQGPAYPQQNKGPAHAQSTRNFFVPFELLASSHRHRISGPALQTSREPTRMGRLMKSALDKGTFSSPARPAGLSCLWGD